MASRKVCTKYAPACGVFERQCRSSALIEQPGTQAIKREH
jgi:hypothetical protein